MGDDGASPLGYGLPFGRVRNVELLLFLGAQIFAVDLGPPVGQKRKRTISGLVRHYLHIGIAIGVGDPGPAPALFLESLIQALKNSSRTRTVAGASLKERVCHCSGLLGS
eukprot:7516984-Pyramimonas_sp.AAC.1